MHARRSHLPGTLAGAGLLSASRGWACAQCRPQVAAQLYDADFLPHALLLAAPVAILLIIAIVLHNAADAGRTHPPQKRSS